MYQLSGTWYQVHFLAALQRSGSNRATPIGQSGRPPKNMPIERCSEGANRAQPIEPIVPRATIEFGKRLRFSAEGGQPWWHFKLPPWDFLLAYPASRHPSIRVSTKGGGRRPPPLCGGGRRPLPLWMCVEAGRARRKSHNFPPWNIMSHRGISFPPVEYHFPPWNFKSHRGIAYSTMA